MKPPSRNAVPDPVPRSRGRVTAVEIAGLLFATLFPTLGVWLYFDRFADTVFFGPLYAGSKIIQFGFPLVWVRVIERGLRRPRPPLAGSGAGTTPLGRRLIRGLPTGVGISGIVLGVYLLTFRGTEAAAATSGRLVARLEAMGAGTLLGYLVMAVFLSLVHSFLEEYYWRWFLFGRLGSRAGRTGALILSSVAFAAHHVVVLWYYLGSGPQEWLVWVFSAGVALGGGVWAWQYGRTGSLLTIWVSHAVVDLALMGIGYDLAMAAA